MRIILRPLAALNRYLKQSTTVYMVLVASFVGLLGGYSAVLLRMMIQYGQKLIWSTPELPSEHWSLLEWTETLPWYWLVLAPTIGGFFVGLIVHYGASEARGHGVPEVMAAVATKGGKIRPRVAGVKALASSLCIASGGSVGREGPIVQIGSAIGSSVAQTLGLGPRRMRTLVGCGAAAGIAAAFNAPIAGAMFAVEVILGDFGVPQFSPIVISSVVATVVARHFLGDFPAFEIPAYSMHSPVELLGYAVLGILAAFTALLFTRTLHATETFSERTPIWEPFKTAIGGLLVGLLALAVPQVLGVGYEAMNDALDGHMGLFMLFALLLAKLVAVCLTLGTGGSGGIFAPSLFLGAMLGGAVGVGMQMLMPGSAPPGAYALVGMGAVVAAGTHAPITAIMILFELTADYKIILPLMISCILATLIVMRLSRDSIYTIKLSERGIQVRRGQDINLLSSIPVTEVTRESSSMVLPNERLEPLLRRIFNQGESLLAVANEDGQYLGTIGLKELRPFLEEEGMVRQLLTAEDIANAEIPGIQSNATLDAVLEDLDKGYRDEMPVVSPEGKLVGIVHLADVLERYRRELFKTQMAGELAGSLALTDSGRHRHKVGGFVMAEIESPAFMAGLTISGAAFRQRYGVNVLLLRRLSADGQLMEPQTVNPDDILHPGDFLVVFGPEKDVDRLQTLV
ncbi:MAG: chloride channel protein [Planctomycetota bacterium]